MPGTSHTLELLHKTWQQWTSGDTIPHLSVQQLSLQQKLAILEEKSKIKDEITAITPNTTFRYAAFINSEVMLQKLRPSSMNKRGIVVRKV